MTKRIHKFLLTLLALAALAFGGATVSHAATAPDQTGTETSTEQESTAPENSATDPDNVQFEQQGNNEGDNGSAAAQGASQSRSVKKKAHRRHHRRHHSGKSTRGSMIAAGQGSGQHY
jgi:hypothetical protein